METQQLIGASDIYDSFCWEEHCKIITPNEHGVHGLRNFTHVKRLGTEPVAPVHCHAGVMEVQCVVKGKRNTKLCRADGSWEDNVYTGGEAFVVFPGEYHVTGNTTQQEPCEFYTVQLDLEEADDFLGLNPQKGRALCTVLKAMRARHVRMKQTELNILRTAFSLIGRPNPSPMQRDEGLAHLICFLYRFAHLPPANAMLRDESDARIQAAVEYIDQNLSEVQSLQVLADHVGLSLSRFKTCFREEVGQTPGAYISARRVERAKLALANSDASITEIAYELGWSSGNYFCTVFHKLTGSSPIEYRRRSHETGGE